MGVEAVDFDVRKNKDQQRGLFMIKTNTPEEAEQYAKKGVDGVATDKPDILKRTKITVNA